MLQCQAPPESDKLILLFASGNGWSRVEHGLVQGLRVRATFRLTRAIAQEDGALTLYPEQLGLVLPLDQPLNASNLDQFQPAPFAMERLIHIYAGIYAGLRGAILMRTNYREMVVFFPRTGRNVPVLDGLGVVGHLFLASTLDFFEAVAMSTWLVYF